MSMAKVADILSGFRETLTKYLATISSDHAHIHKGRAFSLGGSTTIANGGTYKITFTTPNPNDPAVAATGQKYLHSRPAFVVGASGGVSWVLYEGSTGVSGGTASTPINLNRNSTRTAKTTYTIGTTVTGNGAAVQYGSGGTAGNPAQAASGASGAEHERVLAPNTVYTLVITNLYAGDNVTTYDVYGYEEDYNG